MYMNGMWTDPSVIAVESSSVPIYSATLFEGSPAIAVFHERMAGRADEDIDVPVDPNDTQILVSLGLPDGQGGWKWHEPMLYAGHNEVAYSGFDAALTDSGHPVVMWTAKNVTESEEDTDHYFNYRALGSGFLGDPLYQPAPESEIPEAKYYSNDEFELPDWQPFEQADVECKNFGAAFPVTFGLSKNSSKSQAKVLTRLFGTHELSISGILEGAANLKEAKVGGGLDVAVSLFTDSLKALDRSPNEKLTDAESKKLSNSGRGVFITGKARLAAGWKVNRDSCKYEFDKWTASLGLAVRARVPIPNLSFSAGPLAELYVGIQIDAILGGDFVWEHESRIPSLSTVSLEGGVGGYFVGKALNGTLVLSGTLTGNLKIAVDSKGMNLKEIALNGGFTAMVGKWTRSYAVKYNFLDSSLTVTGGVTRDVGGITPPQAYGFNPVLAEADENGFSRSFNDANGWEIEESVDIGNKAGTSADYSVNGVSTAVLSNVVADMEDDSKPDLFTTSEGDTFAFWIREKGTTGTELTNSLMYVEFDGNNWGAPMEIPGITGANREVKAIEDANGKLLLVFAHADMTGFYANSDVGEALAAYEEVDLCYIRKTDTGWSSPQILSKIPGTANNLRLHSLPDSSVFASWRESSLDMSKLYVQKWDHKNMLWLPFSKLSNANVMSNAALGQVGDNPMAIWSELVDTGDGTSAFDFVEQLTYANLTNGSWNDSAPLDLDFYTPEEDTSPSLLSSRDNDLISGIETRGSSFSAVFDINHLVKIPILCFGDPIDNIPDIKLPEQFIPDERKWPTKGGSLDPNDKFGFNGHGPEGWIGEGFVIPYTILFENDPEEGATAPALRVRILDQLDPDYDYDTFVFREFGWAELRQELPEETQHFEVDVDYQNSDGSPLTVRVKGTFDRGTGEIVILFDSLDPATGITPFGAFDGFLQVEDESGNGQGFVRYDVQQKAGLPQGTEFENTAKIFFDLNEPIDTPTVLHTIDLEAPTSMADSPAVSDSSSFTVSLNGSDPDGSGVAYYTVYQSVDEIGRAHV
jgi:hypothetical protein